MLVVSFHAGHAVLQAIEELRERVEENTALLHHILRRMSSKKSESYTQSHSHGFALPITDMETFQQINEELHDETKASQLVSYTYVDK